MAILSCHVSIKLPPKISDGQEKGSGLRPNAVLSATAPILWSLKNVA